MSVGESVKTKIVVRLITSTENHPAIKDRVSYVTENQCQMKVYYVNLDETGYVEDAQRLQGSIIYLGCGYWSSEQAFRMWRSCPHELRFPPHFMKLW